MSMSARIVYDAMNDQGEFSAPGGWATYFIIFQFLDASSHLYKRVCPSVGPSVRPSVGPSVGPSVRRSVRQSVRYAFSKIAKID